MKTISALSARSRLGTILDEVSQEGIHYVIERLSRPLVAIIPVKEYQKYMENMTNQKKQEEQKELLEEILAFRKKYRKKFSKGEDSVTSIRKQREARTKQIMEAAGI